MRRRSFLTQSLTGIALAALVRIGCAAEQAPSTDKPIFSFGVVADVQYADKDPRLGRSYRDSLAKAARCVEAWNRHDLDFAIDLGDLTDDRPEGTREDLDRVLKVLKPPKAPLYHVLGNHGPPTAGREAVLAALGLKQTYYDFARHGRRFVVLDATGLHLKCWPPDSPRARESEAYYRAHRGKGKPEFADYNGGIDAEQLRWLRETLARAAERREPVVVFCHMPVLAEASSRTHLLWNHEKVLGVLESCPTLVAFMAGHDHRGGYALRKGIHHVTLQGMVETPQGGNAFGVVDVFADRLEIRGQGALESRVLILASGGARRIHAKVRGTVQGVGFRDFTCRHATALKLTGWVRNLPDGDVELVAEGAVEALQALVERLHEGPPSSKVTGVSILEVKAATREFKGFEVRY